MLRSYCFTAPPSCCLTGPELQGPSGNFRNTVRLGPWLVRVEAGRPLAYAGVIRGLSPGSGRSLAAWVYLTLAVSHAPGTYHHD